MPAQTFTKHQISTVIVLMMVLMSHGSYGRYNMGAGAYIVRQELPQMFLEELMGGVNDETLYNELKKYHANQPKYSSKWPALRDLLLTADYDDAIDSNENGNGRFLERLRQLATNSVAMEEADHQGNELGNDVQAIQSPPLKSTPTAALTSSKLSFKDHGAKKNTQYMSPCHFKICNMGRKRNARLFNYF